MAAVDPDEKKLDDDIGDDLLRLIFTSCHPVLSMEARVALTLRLIGGLTTDEIARAYLVPEPTVAQRIVRAKKTIAEAHVPFEVPRGADRDERLGSVLGVDLPGLQRGLRRHLGRGLAAAAALRRRDPARPHLAEVGAGGIGSAWAVSLMEIQASRFAARTDAAGDPVLLLDQNRGLWDRLLIRRGLAALAQAEATAAAPAIALGSYAFQASIAACHARALTPEATDWPRIVGLYEKLGAVTLSPVVDLNRAVAVSLAFGPAAGLDLVDRLVGEPALKNYALLPGVRGDLLVKLGRLAEARVEFERAASLTRNERERALLLKRAAECEATITTPS